MITTNYRSEAGDEALYVSIPARDANAASIIDALRLEGRDQAVVVLRGASGHGKSALCRHVLDDLSKSEGALRAHVKVATSVQDWSAAQSGYFLMETAKAVALHHQQHLSDLSAIKFLEMQNDDTSAELVNKFKDSLVMHAGNFVPWEHPNLDPSQKLHISQFYLEHALSRHPHLINIENAQIIDRESASILRRFIKQNIKLCYLLEYTDDSLWSEWTHKSIRKYLVKDTDAEHTWKTLSLISPKDAARILNEKLNANGVHCHFEVAGTNLRIGDTLCAMVRAGRFGKLVEVKVPDPEHYLNDLTANQKHLLAIIAVYGSGVPAEWLKELIGALNRDHFGDLVLQQDLDTLISYGLIIRQSGGYNTYFGIAHDFDRHTVLTTEGFAAARDEACRVWFEMLKVERQLWRLRLDLTQRSAGFGGIYGGYWYILATSKKWGDLLREVRTTLNDVVVRDLPELATELRRLMVILRAQPDDSPVFIALKKEIGWRTVINLYVTMYFDEADDILKDLDDDGPLANIIRSSLDAMQGRSVVCISKLQDLVREIHSLDLPEALKANYELLLNTVGIHAALEKNSESDYREAYGKVFNNPTYSEVHAGYSSFLRLTSRKLKAAGGSISDEVIKERLKASIRLADREGGTVQEQAVTRVTFSQVVADMVTGPDRLSDLREATEALDEAERVVKNVEFDKHSILNNRGALALLRWGIAPAESDKDIDQAIRDLRNAALFCDYDYGLLMIFSNLALAYAFRGLPDALTALQPRIRRLHEVNNVEDTGMRRRGWLNTGFAHAYCGGEEHRALAKYYLDALDAEGCPLDVERRPTMDWRISRDRLAKAIEAGPGNPELQVDFKPTLMAFWHVFPDLTLPITREGWSLAEELGGPGSATRPPRPRKRRLTTWVARRIPPTARN